MLVFDPLRFAALEVDTVDRWTVEYNDRDGHVPTLSVYTTFRQLAQTEQHQITFELTLVHAASCDAHSRRATGC